MLAYTSDFTLKCTSEVIELTYIHIIHFTWSHKALLLLTPIPLNLEEKTDEWQDKMMNVMKCKLVCMNECTRHKHLYQFRVKHTTRNISIKKNLRQSKSVKSFTLKVRCMVGDSFQRWSMESENECCLCKKITFDGHEQLSLHTKRKLLERKPITNHSQNNLAQNNLWPSFFIML